ncbi:hypothetical protein RYX36_000471 [Vicia faba]
MGREEEEVAVGVPANALIGDPKGIPIQETIYRDTPAPFNCPHCGHTDLTTVRSKISLAAFVGCLMPMMVGVCFLCPSMDCLWHKYHYCPDCQLKVLVILMMTCLSLPCLSTAHVIVCRLLILRNQIYVLSWIRQTGRRRALHSPDTSIICLNHVSY